MSDSGGSEGDEWVLRTQQRSLERTDLMGRAKRQMSTQKEEASNGFSLSPNSLHGRGAQARRCRVDIGDPKGTMEKYTSGIKK